MIGRIKRMQKFCYSIEYTRNSSSFLLRISRFVGRDGEAGIFLLKQCFRLRVVSGTVRLHETHENLRLLLARTIT